VPPPSPRRWRPAGVVQHLLAGPSPRREAHLRAADKAHVWADGIKHRSMGRLSRCLEMALEAADVPPQQKPARRHDHLRVIAVASSPRKSLHAVTARSLGRWGVTGGQAPSSQRAPCGRTIVLSHASLFAFSVMATLSTLTRPQISEDTNADCNLENGEQVPYSSYMCASLHFKSTLS